MLHICLFWTSKRNVLLEKTKLDEDEVQLESYKSSRSFVTEEAPIFGRVILRQGSYLSGVVAFPTGFFSFLLAFYFKKSIVIGVMG